MNDFKRFMNDTFVFSPIERFIFGERDNDTLSHYDNYLSDNYIENKLKLIKKYENTKNIELKNLLNSYKFSFNNKLYLLLFSSFDNFIFNFLKDNETLYPENSVQKKSRENDFDELIKISIIRAKEGLRHNITFPKIIIRKFMNDIKKLKKFNNLYTFLKNEYYPHTRTEIGLCYLHNGKKIYEQLLKENIGYLNISPEYIHNLGLRLLENIKKNVRYETYESREEMYLDCLKYGRYIYENIIDRYFHYKPDKIFIIEKMDSEEEKNSPLGYYKPLEHKIFINLSYYREISKNEIYSLIMHECFHSYHFDFMKYYKVPKYKYYKYSNTALAEGFAFYMETYCENYDDDDNNMSLMRKLRLVVDTGINYYGWTYKQAYDYMISYMPDKKSDIKNEIDRYICNPSQAISYMIGKLHIIHLKNKYLNNGGNIKDFHHYLLIEGHASFKTIDENFNRRIRKLLNTPNYYSSIAQ